MVEIRGRLGEGDLLGVVRAAFGERELVSVERLRGGSKKGVYRLVLDDRTTSIAYVWNAEENYWPDAASQDQSDPFGHADGLDLFEAAHAALSSIAVRVPRVVMVDRSRSLLAGEVAVLEDVRGGTLEALRERDSRRASRVLARLGDVVRAMQDSRRDRYGRPGVDRAGDTDPVEQIVLRRALGQLAETAARVDRLAAVEHRLRDLLCERHAAVAPRTEYGFIHGELGPDHVLVDDHDEPVLIDIEGAMFFDVEWEHAFLELRFGSDYPFFRRAGLDRDRMRFYRLAMYLSLVAGPLRLLDGDFPDRPVMLEIVEQNIDRTLAQLT
ncbi:phosphotransferase family protein [Amycolatopsis mediterranei]|uniref:Aminoglycoside phosphotransferase n=1 Tax=Amycolatopsis mediterranei (strain U-32) TaxID=749927 RepID=A0A0H3DAZ2_AMYMU|nr:phosphotransferase [Amycolatopsis mediterranei]ADJ48185.1 aminoglycoside phosphotransferase [Amycolatopsis mediterranei U32]AGT87024.1 aminoglycoside phosphotransferase [Amycolatopsis mediterranei RB]KDO10670.1 aminoglycoside phosphotransferase [Amycolatopsis mediterranei]KDU87132.1 aminoglycoside phosphotransferase [Amycolatopsis mediterranei]UZF73183.1 phosphotransferase [Amycolatopsis mediterranei]